MSNSGLMPIGRFEWERVLRRIVMPAPQKYLAFVLATYADPDGTRVRPGLDELAGVVGQSTRNIKRHLADLRDLGLLDQTRRGGGRGGHGRTTEYRLTIPPDLLDRAELVPLEGRNPGRRPESGDTQMSPQSDHSPVDNPAAAVHNHAETGDNQPIGNDFQGTYDVPPKPIEGTFSAIEGTSCMAHYHPPDQPPGPPTYSPTQDELRPRAKPRRTKRRRRSRLRRTPTPARGPPHASQAVLNPHRPHRSHP